MNDSSENKLRSAILPLQGQGKIAFVVSPRLGDALIAMTLVYNLFKQGYDLYVYSNFIADLKEWFPWANVFPYPDTMDLKDIKALWSGYHLLLHRYPHDVRYESNLWHPCVFSLSDLSLYRQCQNEVDSQLLICEKVLNIQQPVRANGITIPKGLVFRRYQKRIAIHPTASAKVRCWLPRQFIKLSQRLIKEGYEPIFLVAPHEAEDTLWIKEAGLTRSVTKSIKESAEIIAESGWFIGNDSGLGHLASCLGIPTVSMHPRRKNRISWSPGFALNKALIPKVNLLVKPWKEKYWKYFLSVNQVYNAFVDLKKTYEG